MAVLCAGAGFCCACMDYGPLHEEPFAQSQRGVFITCEGNFGWDNASLSFYDPAARSVENEIFIRANGMKLGDVAQSMTLHKGRGYVVVNNSGAVYVIDPATFRVTGVIEGVVSPRYIHFPNDTTAYITDLYDPRITVVDSRSNRIRGRIPMNGHKSTEQMVQWGDEVFVNCWSYDDKILVVDAARETLVDSIEVGPQPSSLVLDRFGKLWTVTDGRTAGIPAALYRIDAATRRIEQTYTFAAATIPRRSPSTARATRSTSSTATSGACGSTPRSCRHAVPALYADHLLRSGGRSADLGGLRGRRHRLRPARRGLPLHGAGRGRRHDTRRHHPRIVLFQTVKNIRRR